MATARTWRGAHPDGPYPAVVDDIPALNHVFSEAFTERYRRDGLVGVRVPHLNPIVWRYAIEDAGAGALIWRDERDDIVAFNIVHRSGVEGWMGPLAVRSDKQNLGLGKEIVRSGVEWLKVKHSRTIGLETMPRTMDNIGFYSALGFAPGKLTISVSLDAANGTTPPLLLSKMPPRERAGIVEECRTLASSVISGYDFTREIVLSEQLGLGDTVLLESGTRILGYALCHIVPLVEGRASDETRVLKLVLADEAHLPALVDALTDYARRAGTRRVAFRVQTEHIGAYRALIRLGGRVRWTDLRMTVDGYEEPKPERGVVFSNWEI